MRHRPLHIGNNRRLSAPIFILVAAVAITVAPTAAESPEGTDSTGISNSPALNQYRALRRMHAATGKLNHEGWMEAWTELEGNTFRYEIVSERGSETIRKKVLRALLERERELYASGEPGRSELTSENYEFAPETTGPGCKYVLLKPKRKDSLLVEGRMVLSEDGRDLLRVEGKLSKNPSFWTSLVNVVRRYARLEGVRVPIATESTAKVKFVGDSKLHVEYEYETINGRPVSLQARRLVAQRN